MKKEVEILKYYMTGEKNEKSTFQSYLIVNPTLPNI